MAGRGSMLASLLLNSKDFDTKIKKSGKNVDEFSKKNISAADVIEKQFKKIAGVVFTVKALDKAIDAFFKSSQMNSDALASSMQTLKTITDNVVYSFANADFTPFINGLADMAAKAREAYAAQDQLANTAMSYGYVSAVSGSKYREAISAARNKNLSIDERRAALAAAGAERDKLASAQKQYSEKSFAAISTTIAASSGLDSKLITEEILDKIFRIDAVNPEAQRAEIADEYKKYKSSLSQLEAQVEKEYTVTTTSPIIGGRSETQKLEGYEEAMAAVRKEQQRMRDANAELVVAYELLFKATDDTLQGHIELAKAAFQTKNQISEQNTSINEVTVSLNNEAAALAKVNAEMTALATRNATTPYALGGPTGLTSEMVDAANADARERMKGTSSASRRRKSDKPELKFLDVKVLMGEDTKVMEEEVDRFAEMTEGVGMLDSALSQLGNTLGGTTGGMVEFVGSIFKAVQAIIPFIAYLFAEKEAHKANANAAATEAGAKAMSSVAGIPFAGIGLGVAAIADIVAAIQAIPKFAEGGIVTSATLGLFGEAGPEAVMPLDRLSDFVRGNDVRVTGNIKASGKDLVVVIDNYNKVRSVRG